MFEEKFWQVIRTLHPNHGRRVEIIMLLLWILTQEFRETFLNALLRRVAGCALKHGSATLGRHIVFLPKWNYGLPVYMAVDVLTNFPYETLVYLVNCLEIVTEISAHK